MFLRAYRSREQLIANEEIITGNLAKAITNWIGGLLK